MRGAKVTLRADVGCDFNIHHPVIILRCPKIFFSSQGAAFYYICLDGTIRQYKKMLVVHNE